METTIDVIPENPSVGADSMTETDPDVLLENDTLEPGLPGVKPYYILRECESNSMRVRLLRKIGTIVKNRLGPEARNDQAKVCYIDVDGEYFPDFLEEDGYQLVSVPLLAYLEYKFDFVPLAPYRIALVAEAGRRIEEYALLLPDELDCVVAESMVHNEKQVLEYFELDLARVGGGEIFKVKDFPHLLLARKLNRIEFAGVECIRIDRYFDYEAKEAELSRARLESQHPEQLLKKLEAAATMGPDSLNIKEFLKAVGSGTVNYDFNRGLRDVFESFQPRPQRNLEFAADSLEFVWSWEREACELVRGREFFREPGFAFKYLTELKAVWGKLPETVRADGYKLCFDTVKTAAGNATQAMFGRFERIHGNRKFRIYLREAAEPAAKAFLIHEFKGRSSASSQPSSDSVDVDLNNRDLRGSDFSGRQFAGLKITGSNLSRVRFHGSRLNRVEFCNCDLSGAEFKDANLIGAKFIDCRLDRAGFEQAELKGSEITGCSLEHTRFVKGSLIELKLSAEALFCTYFYRSRIYNAVFTVPGALTGCVFRLCDLRNTHFNGDLQVFNNNLEDCDFRNADLSGCKFATRGVARCRFDKAKLQNVDFSGCKEINSCDFRWSNCIGVNLTGISFKNNNLTFVDLSRLQPKRGAVFYGNDLSYTNFEGYDFGAEAVLIGNQLIYTNLTNCNLTDAWLNDSKILYPILQGADLKGAHFKSEQLKHVNLSKKQLQEIEIYQTEEKEEDLEMEED
jgi:uncharacterized protein YjbI with pentapeptide repeats